MVGWSHGIQVPPTHTHRTSCESTVNHDVSAFGTNVSVIRSNGNDRNHLWEKLNWRVIFSLVNVPYASKEGVEFMMETAASHQRAIKMLWLHYWAAVMSIFIYSLRFAPTQILYTLIDFFCHLGAAQQAVNTELTHDVDVRNTITDHLCLFTWYLFYRVSIFILFSS